MKLMHDVLELIYFLSGPAIAIFAWRGLAQLKISKEASQLSAKRESYRLAADQVKYYLEHTVPLLNTLAQVCQERGITIFEKAHLDITGNEIKMHFPEDYKPIPDLITMTAEITAALNSLESFAVPFVARVADEQVAFASVGKSFHDTVLKYMPAIVTVADALYYRSIIRLFFLWHPRLEQLELMRDKKRIEKRLEKIENKVINPLGT